MSWLSKTVNDSSNAAKNTVENASKAAKDVTDEVSNAAGSAIGPLVRTVGGGAHQVADAVARAGDSLNHATQAAGDAAALLDRNAAFVVSKATKDAAADLANRAQQAAESARAAANDARQAADAISRGTGGAFGRNFGGLAIKARTAVKAAEDAADAAEKLAAAAADAAEQLANKVSEVAAIVGEQVAEQIKQSPLYQWLVANLAGLFMDPPALIKRGEEYGGLPIYYVNGILTSRQDASDDAALLADKMKRPVYLIPNPTCLEGSTGNSMFWDDLTECIYDRAWPLTLASGITPVDPLSVPFAQHDMTTRQITWVLYHAEGPLAIVSHSQGCLQVRNAVLTAALFRGTNWTHSQLAWVAAGSPLASPPEVWPLPKKFTSIVNAGDPVAQVIGLQGGPGTLDAILVKNLHHRFRTQYLPKIDPMWLTF